MSILTENSRRMLVESMRGCLSDVLHESTSLTSKQATEKIKFVTESATYEQLLNITMNPHRQEKYLPAYVLEGAVAILHSACMTGRQNIGVNAITEGALKLQKKTGAVITESMLDAALTSVREGCGLKVVGKILTESMEGQFAQIIGKWINTAEADVPGVWDSTIRARLYNDIHKTNAALKAAGARATDAQKQAFADAVKALNTARGEAVNRWYNLARTRPGDLPSTLVKRLGGIDNVKQLENGGKEVFQQARSWGKIKQLEQRISELQSRHATMAKEAIPQSERDTLKSLQRNLDRLKGIAGGGGGRNPYRNVAGSNLGKTPWGKIALGAAAAGGAGALAWKWYQNKKAMQRDMANGTSPY